MTTCKIDVLDSGSDDEVSYADFIRTGEDLHHYPTYRVFKENQRRLIAEIAKIAPKAVVLLQGGPLLYHYDTNIAYEFRQESYFYWLFGVVEPDCYGSLDIATGDVILYMPKLDVQNFVSTNSDVSLQSGENTWKNLYDVKHVYTHEKLDKTLSLSKPESVLVLGGSNAETGRPLHSAKFNNIYSLPIDQNSLVPIISNLRATKTIHEINIMKRGAIIVSEALKYIMMRIKSGNYEFQADAIFKHFCFYTAGCKLTSCFGICASGPNVYNLNYQGPMTRIIANGDLCILEMGTMYCGYAAKAVVTYPADGKFLWKQKIIYSVALTIREKVLHLIKAGANCTDLQVYAHQVLLEEIKNLGLVKGDVMEMLRAGAGSVFSPLSLIQFIGLDYEDVGGFIDKLTPGPACAKWLSFMKTTRLLEENMVITFRPSIFILSERIEQALADPEIAKFLVKEAIDRFLEVGAIKMEDMLVISSGGYEMLTHLPRSIHAIEKWLAQQIETYITKVFNHSIFNNLYTIEDSCSDGSSNAGY